MLYQLSGHYTQDKGKNKLKLNNVSERCNFVSESEGARKGTESVLQKEKKRENKGTICVVAKRARLVVVLKKGRRIQRDKKVWLE